MSLVLNSSFVKYSKSTNRFFKSRNIYSASSLGSFSNIVNADKALALTSTSLKKLVPSSSSFSSTASSAASTAKSSSLLISHSAEYAALYTSLSSSIFSAVFVLPSYTKYFAGFPAVP